MHLSAHAANEGGIRNSGMQSAGFILRLSTCCLEQTNRSLDIDAYARVDAIGMWCAKNRRKSKLMTGALWNWLLVILCVAAYLADDTV